MIRELSEHAVDCPFCGESIDLLIDLSEGSTAYVEDCQVCCQPMQVSVQIDGDEVTYLSVDRDD